METLTQTQTQTQTLNLNVIQNAGPDNAPDPFPLHTHSTSWDAPSQPFKVNLYPQQLCVLGAALPPLGSYHSLPPVANTLHSAHNRTSCWQLYCCDAVQFTVEWLTISNVRHS